MLDYAKCVMGKTTVRFLDPAFGSGSFFSALLQKFSFDQISEGVGYEIDPYYGNAALDLWRHQQLKLYLEDFTLALPPETDDEKANLLICNPPYVRHHYLPKTEKQRLQKRGEQITGIRLNEQTGLYGHFLCIAHAWMAPNSLAGWLIPSEFMDVRYGEHIKAYLLKEVTLLRIHCFRQGNVQFHDALVSSSIVWFRNTPPPTNYTIELTYGGTFTKPEFVINLQNDKLAANKKWTKLFSHQEPSKRIEEKILPHIHTSIWHAAQKTSDQEVLLAHLFDVKRGLATGNNNFFLLSKDLIAKYQLPMQFMKPVLPNPRYLPLDEVNADNLGNPILKNNLFLLDCNLSEDEIKAKYPTLWNYLQIGIATKVHHGYLCRYRKLWYSQEKRPISLFLCAYMGRTDLKKKTPFRFILNHSKATATNAYHILYPKPFLQKAIEETPEIGKAIWESLCSIPLEILINESRIYGGGLHKMEPGELANVSAVTVLETLQRYSVSIPNLRQNPNVALQKAKKSAGAINSLWSSL
jgi:adenine-specific DNA-methyltransferase